MNRKAFREKVYERDKGVCSKCGLDVSAVELSISNLKSIRTPCSVIDEAFNSLSFSNASTSTLWEADHIVPIAEGGEDCLGNLRTLCQACHKVETKMLKARLSRAIKKKTKCIQCRFVPSKKLSGEIVYKCKVCRVCRL